MPTRARNPEHCENRRVLAPGIRWGGLTALLALTLIGPSRLSAQSARHTMLATATVVAEESYSAREAVEAAMLTRIANRGARRQYKDITILEREAPSPTPYAKPERVITVFFTGT